MRKKPCKACSMAKRMKMRKKSRSGVYGIGRKKMGAIPTQQLLAMGVGALAAKYADLLLVQIPVQMVQDNKQLRDGVKTALGVFMSMQKNEMVANAGLGMAAFGAANLIGSFIPTATIDPDNATVRGISGSGRYDIGTGPVQMGYLGPQPNYQTVSGINAWDGIGTEPDMIAGNYVDSMNNGGLKVV